MSFHRISILAAAAALLASATAVAKQEVRANGAAAESERVQLLADVVVNGTQQPAPPPAPAAPVVVQPAPAPAPVVAPAETHSSTVVEHENHSYMGTIVWSALGGGITGALIGGAIYYLSDNQTHPARIGYWAAGGVLVGTAVGVTQIAIQESRVDRATASLPSDPAPTMRLALYRLAF